MSENKTKGCHLNDASRYTKAKIYKIINPDTPDVYIGSTNYDYLSMRFYRHKVDAPHCDRFGDIFKTDNARIELVEDYPCRNKEELRFRERFWIETTDNCINQQIPILTNNERLERARKIQKDWYWKKGGREMRKKQHAAKKIKNTAKIDKINVETQDVLKLITEPSEQTEDC